MTTPHPIVLTPEERAECRRILEAPDATPYKRQRALILLLAERRPGERCPSNETIAQLADVNRRTVTRVRGAFLRDGFARTLQSQPSTRLVARKLSREQEQRLFALLDTPPPPGHPRWTVRTLATAASSLEGMPEISRELVRRLLKLHRPGPAGEDPPEPPAASAGT
jgi:DNA-binding MarR family transcriptional regulator